jgi:hypothetical protein
MPHILNRKNTSLYDLRRPNLFLFRSYATHPLKPQYRWYHPAHLVSHNSRPRFSIPTAS